MRSPVLRSLVPAGAGSASSSPARRPAGGLRRALSAGAALLTVTALVTSCALLEGPQPETPERKAPEEPEVAPELIPGGSAEENLPYFTEVLRAYSESEDPITGRPIVDAVVESGFDRAAMQVSFDQSKTGLAADNIFVSVRIDAGCLLGQLVAEDRSFVAEAVPAVGPEKNICIIGETRPIDW